MAITFGGDKFESTERIVTKCHSLDDALSDNQGNVGIPLRAIIEVYGGKNVGKSTFCDSLVGMIAYALRRDVTLLDWEGQNKDTIEQTLEHQKFGGHVQYLLNKGTETSEETLERFVAEMANEKQNVGLMDSIGGFIPTAYSEGSIADSNMGVFAREIGRFTSKLNRVIIRSEKAGVCFLTNHVHPTIGSMVTGQSTSGGETKKYLAHVRIDLKRAYIANSPVNFGDSYLLKGRVDSNRYGYSLRDFHVFIVAGEGIHIGLSALWDCVIAGYATLSAKSIKDSVQVSMDGINYGKFRTILKEKDNPEFFVPFINAIRQSVDDEIVEEEEVEPLFYAGKDAEDKIFGMPEKKKRSKK